MERTSKTESKFGRRKGAHTCVCNIHVHKYLEDFTAETYFINYKDVDVWKYIIL